MNFRTELNIEPSDRKIDHRSKVFATGSCFARHIASRLARAKIAVTENPFGEMFNPLSVADQLRTLAEGRRFTAADLVCADGVWISFAHHGSFDGEERDRVLADINDAARRGAESLREADTVIVTLGTAWVYESVVTGRVVANCHKHPQSEFVRRRLSVEEVASAFDDLLTGPLADKTVILSVSPVRHLADGLAENSLSKSILRVAAAEIADRHPNVCYFPAYELLVDDLRDYRFYADDMTHPSSRAVEYVWEKFAGVFFTSATAAAAERFERLAAGAEHRPLHPESRSWTEFKRSMLRQVEQLQAEFPYVDLTRERELFSE